MCPRACVSSSRTGSGIGGATAVFPFGSCGFEQLRLDHAGRCRNGTAQLAGNFPQIGDNQKETEACRERTNHFGLRPGSRATIDNRFRLFPQESRELAQLFEGIPHGWQRTPEIVCRETGTVCRIAC